jgi:hypothetical protein
MLNFLPGELIVRGRCVYRTDDMMLEYETSIHQPANLTLPVLSDVLDRKFNLDTPSDLLLIADTLTLTFSGSDYHLASLDAYTNKQLWDVSPFEKVPEIRGQGSLLAEPTSFGGDRCSLGFRPKYEIASNQQWVRVVLSGGNPEHYYEIASNLIVGLRNKIITDMYLLNIVFL